MKREKINLYINLIPFTSKRAGAEKYSLNFIEYLSKSDNTNFEPILLLNPESKAFFNSDKKFKYIECFINPHKKISRVFYEQFILPFKLKRGNSLFFSPSNILPIPLRIPSVVTTFDLHWYNLKNLFPKQEKYKLSYIKTFIRLSAKKARKIITLSKSTRNDLISTLGIPEEKIVIIPPGVDEHYRIIDKSEAQNFVKKKFNIPGNFVLHVGQTHRRKNIPFLLKIFEKIKEKNALDLVLAGPPGDGEKEILRLIQESCFKKNIHKFNELPEKDLLYLYNAASCLIFPSLYEGYGLPVVEAMACGCPVVCSDRTAIPESAGGAALLCGSDEEEWIKAIMKIINDDGQRSELVKKGLERVKQLSWERTVEDMLETFESIKS
ncbi:MAG: glycosyltransferase family 4 protein [Candidatus Lokiarchaeota archaeon]|nr:glycosyltransferase family 4 protein [Candidatus Lokiarchaeota archaeon]